MNGEQNTDMEKQYYFSARINPSCVRRCLVPIENLWGSRATTRVLSTRDAFKRTRVSASTLTCNCASEYSMRKYMDPCVSYARRDTCVSLKRTPKRIDVCTVVYVCVYVCAYVNVKTRGVVSAPLCRILHPLAVALIHRIVKWH